MEVKTSHNPNFHIWPENSLNVKRPCWEGGQVYFTHRTIIMPQSSPRDCWWGLLLRKYSKLLGVYKSTTRTPVLPLRDIMEKSLPLTTIPEAMRMDKFMGYLNIGTGININAWFFSDLSLSVAISPCLCAVQQDLLGGTELNGLKDSGGHCVHQGHCVCHNVIPLRVMPRCFAALLSVGHWLVAPSEK